MNIPAISNQVSAMDLPLDQLAGNPNIPEPAKVGEACRQFEAMLLRQMLQEARKPMFDSDGEDQSTVSSIYNDMIDNQLADCMSRSGGVGLASGLQAQVTRQAAPNGGGAEAGAGTVTGGVQSPSRKKP
jgi:Rod binding domain-containing protein